MTSPNDGDNGGDDDDDDDDDKTVFMPTLLNRESLFMP